jgi:hypothetical protein
LSVISLLVQKNIKHLFTKRAQSFDPILENASVVLQLDLKWGTAEVAFFKKEIPLQFIIRQIGYFAFMIEIQATILVSSKYISKDAYPSLKK